MGPICGGRDLLCEAMIGTVNSTIYNNVATVLRKMLMLDAVYKYAAPCALVNYFPAQFVDFSSYSSTSSLQKTSGSVKDFEAGIAFFLAILLTFI